MIVRNITETRRSFFIGLSLSRILGAARVERCGFVVGESYARGKSATPHLAVFDKDGKVMWQTP
jgi:hypothetical protein